MRARPLSEALKSYLQPRQNLHVIVIKHNKKTLNQENNDEDISSLTGGEKG